MPTLVSSSSELWSSKSAQYILENINNVIQNNGFCNLMLTGGNTAEKIYLEWANNKDFPFDKINFYFGDERCVNYSDVNSNFNLVKNSLFKYNNIDTFNVFRIKVELESVQKILDDYKEKLPVKIDILLLGLGLDGHIASLFPKSSALYKNNVDLIYVDDPTINFKRFTITPKIIFNSKYIFLLAKGKLKGEVLKKSLDDTANFYYFPVCLVNNSFWLIDNEIIDVLKNK
jgi:6-phosphogluconolactonase